jgi:methionine-rich copper-binding protein CopC
VVRTVRAVVAATVLTLSVLFGVQAPADAHNSLIDSAPKNGAVLGTAPAEVRLKFLAKLDPVTTKVTVSDPAGNSAAVGAARFDGPTVMQTVRPTVAGLYTIGYEVASSDGHPIRGKVTFTLTAAAVPSPTPTAAPTTAPSSIAPSRAAGDDAAGTPAGDAESTPWWPWLVGGLVVLVLLGVGGAVLARRRAQPR